MKFHTPLLLCACLVAAPFGGPAQTPPASAPIAPAPTSSADDFKQVEAADDSAQAEVDRWIRDNNDLKLKGQGVSESELDRRINTRFEPVRHAYEDYLGRHPADAHAHLVFGSFLNARQDEAGAQVQWEKSLELDPANASVYNNLAGRYTEVGPANKVFEYFAKAIELDPKDPVFQRNFADSLYVLRTHAARYYAINEQQVYGKVLLLYSNALHLDPQNFGFARDLAQTYYSLKPLPFDTALSAWTNALRLASAPADRDDVLVHLARVKMLAGRYADARAQVAAVTNTTALPAKNRLLLNLAEREKEQPNPAK